MHFTVEYDDVPAISSDVFLFKIDVHYRGFDVGDVKKIELTEDQKHIRFYVDIHYKDLRLPTNSPIIFKTENVYGSRYLDIESPEKPSDRIIANGDVIDGQEAYERMDEYLLEEFKSGQTGSLIKNMREITDVVKASVDDKKNKKLLDQSAGDLAIILENLKDITGDPSFKRDIKSTIRHSSGSLMSIDEILRKKEMRETINTAPENIKKTLNTIELMNKHMNTVSEVIPEVTKNIAVANTAITEANGNLSAINSKVPPIPQSLVEKTEKLVTRTDCFETEISKVLSKRFAILRLVFGNPGKTFQTCAKCTPCKKARYEKADAKK